MIIDIDYQSKRIAINSSYLVDLELFTGNFSVAPYLIIKTTESKFELTGNEFDLNEIYEKIISKIKNTRNFQKKSFTGSEVTL